MSRKIKSINNKINILIKYKGEKNFEKSKKICKKNNYLRSIFIISTILIFIIFILIFIKFSYLIGINLIDVSNFSKNIIFNDKVYYSKYNNKLLECTNSGFNIYDKKFNINFKFDFEKKFEPFIINNDKFMIIADKNNSIIYVFNSLKCILNRRINGKIEDIYLDEYGNFVVEYLYNETTRKLDILDKKGNLKYTVNLGKITISNVKIINNLEKIIVLENYTEGLNIGTKINVIENNYSIKEILTLENKYIFDIKYFNDKLLLLSNNEILELSLINNKVKVIYNLIEAQISNIKFENIFFYLINRRNDEYFYYTYKYDLTQIGNIKIEKIPKYIRSNSLISYLVYDNKIIAINKWGVKVKEFDILSCPSDLVIFNDGRSIALIYSYKIDILNM